MGRNSGKSKRNSQEYHYSDFSALNSKQDEYLNAIRNNSIIFGVGSAGTGKTYVATSYAAKQLFYRRIDKIILTRPNIEVGRGLGFLPGDIFEKYAPFLEPFEDVLINSLGAGFFDYAIKNKIIQPKPLGYLRGSNFDRAIVLADEMQNATKTEFKMLLSRIGEDCTMIISGDPDQSDISNSGLMDAVNRLSTVDNVNTVRFFPDHIVRSKICKDIILAYNHK